MQSVIFDIDGTLIESTDFDSRLYRQAVTDVLGAVTIRDDWDDYRHVTDGGILRELLEENGISSSASAFGAVKERFIDLVESHLGLEPCTPVRGAAELLRQLDNSETHQIGLATGGWRRTAVAKLESAGLDFAGIPFCSSDDAEDRQEIMRRCLQNIPKPTGSVVYVGDGPWDLRASKGLGWGFIAVGDRLQKIHEPWIRDFARGELEAVLSRLH
ncbi:MAG: HAD family hydrolase [Acidobacteriota bacterium]